MQEYHRVWLEHHPERSEEWLKRMMKEGFDIHHVDGNHDNNDGKNLVLIECGDHLMLHNGSKRFSRFLPADVAARKTAEKVGTVGKDAIDLLERGMSVAEAARELRVTQQTLQKYAILYDSALYSEIIAKQEEKKMKIGALAYQRRAMNDPWPEIKRELHKNADFFARDYAKKHGMIFPPGEVLT